MAQRATQKSVTFLHPFSLTAIDEPISPGTYVIETLEEAIEGVSFIGYRRLSTTLTIASKSYGAAARQVIEIDPAELELALVIDKEQRPISEPGEADAKAADIQH